jgi:NitT/TauT family transport system substrate-binding protein
MKGPSVIKFNFEGRKMKTKIVLVLIMIIAILLSACNVAETATIGQTLVVENTPQSTSTAEPATAVPATAEPVIAKPTEQEMTTLTIVSGKLTSFAPIFIADKEGYFKEFGILLNYITLPRTSDALPLIVSGDIDIYPGALSAGLLNIISQEDNIKVVADRGHIQPGGCTYLGILVRKDLYESGEVTSAAGLAGKTICTKPANDTGFVLDKYLGQAGLTMKDVTINEIPTVGWMDAFANKTLDAIVAPELHITRLINAGNAVLLAGAENIVGDFQLSVMVFGKNLLVNNRDTGVRFLAAYLKGVRQYNEGKTDRNLQIIAEATGEDIEMLKTACWVPIRPDGSIEFSGVDAFQQWSIEQKQLDTPVSEEQFWDPSFLAAAMKLLNP